jgi:hypothetical protein
MSLLTDQHITILRALVQQARATNSDVGMDASVLAALLNERDALRTALRTLADAVAADWSITDTTPANVQAEIFLNVSSAMVTSGEVLS